MDGNFMTWRDKPYPYTEEEMDYYRKYWEKHNKSVNMMKELNIEFEAITRYPHAFPDGLVSIHDLYDIFSDEEKFKDLVSKIKNKVFW
jgi:hypothetical protein